MNTTVERGLADWLSTLLAGDFPAVPVLTADDETAIPGRADAEPRFVRVICEEDVHDLGPLWLPEVMIEIATPMNGALTIAQHRALAQAVVGAFADGNLSALSTAMQSAAGRSVSGWYRLDEDRDALRAREGYWQAGPIWRFGMQEV